jgi:micrococcal nuclease
MKGIAISARLISFVLIVGALLASVNTTYAAGRRPSEVPAGDKAQLVKVMDGETIQVKVNGALATVKYIGVNAPTGGECYSAQAARANANLVSGQRLVLEKDEVDTDASGNLLRYVYLIDGRMVNEELVNSGAARAEISKPNVKHQSLIGQYELAAQAAKRGAWKACGWKPAATAGACPVVQIEDLLVRTPTVPELSLLRAGDCVTINKAANPLGEAWSGQYVYHPAGSKVKLGNMYLRWKDGFVMVVQNSDGQLLAHYVIEHSERRSIVQPTQPGQRPGLSIIPAYSEPTVKALVEEPSSPGTLRIPENALVLRAAGNGEYVALVDVFALKSGEMRMVRVGDGGYVW